MCFEAAAKTRAHECKVMLVQTELNRVNAIDRDELFTLMELHGVEQGMFLLIS